MANLTDYEKQVVEDILKWEQKEPSVSGKICDYLSSQLPDSVKNAADSLVPEKVIAGALRGADALADYLTDTKDIIRDGRVGSIKELQKKSIEVSDVLSYSVENWALGIATVEGGGTGLAGAPGIPVDIAFVVPFAIRTIRKIALCYGFELKGRKGHEEVLAVLSVSGSNTVAEKQVALKQLTEILVMVQKTTWKNIGEKAAQDVASKEALVMAIKAAAKTLGINLTKRKALQIIPLLGAVVGAAMNASFISDVNDAAVYTFQKKWLISNRKWPYPYEIK